MASFSDWALSRMRVAQRTVDAIGFPATLQLLQRRVAAAFGQGSSSIYRIHVRGYPYPVSIRGGNGSDGFALYQILVMKDFDILNDLGSPRLIIDAGANIGMSSLYFLKRYPSVKIVAVEPDPETFEICKMNLAPYGDRVVLLKGAVWSTSGHVVLVKGEFEWNSYVRSADASEDASVEAFDIQSLIVAGGGGAVDLLKVDIEGGEAEVFSANAAQWLPAIRNIVIEFHGDDCEKNFYAALKGYEYDGLPYRTVTAFQNLRAPATARSALNVQ